MNYYNSYLDKDENGKTIYTVTHVTDDKLKYRTMEECARMVIDDRDIMPLNAIPYKLGQTIYWVVGDITDRQVKDLCAVYDKDWDIGVVKFTVKGYMYDNQGLRILVKEIPYYESQFALGKKDEVFSDLEIADRALHD